MKIIDLGVENNPNYSYKYKIKIPEDNKRLLNKIQEWVDTNNMGCLVAGHNIFFLNKRDCTLFLLKWT